MKRRKKRFSVISARVKPISSRVKVKNFDKKLFTLTMFFCIGLLFSAVFFSKSSNFFSAFSLRYLKQNYTIFTTSSFLQCFLCKIRIGFLLLCIVYFLGLFLLGTSLVCLVPALYGFFIGILGSFLYAKASVQGVWYYGIAFVLPSIFSVSTLLVSCKESIFMSHDLTHAFLYGQENVKGKKQLKLYTIRYSIFFIGYVLSALVFSVCSILFKGKFHLNFLF